MQTVKAVRPQLLKVQIKVLPFGRYFFGLALLTRIRVTFCVYQARILFEEFGHRMSISDLALQKINHMHNLIFVHRVYIFNLLLNYTEPLQVLWVVLSL